MGNRKLKVGITGQAGFIGRHLYNFLSTKADEIILIPFQRVFFQEPSKLQIFVSSCDVIVHIAAMNRHEDLNVVYKTNVELVNRLIDACKSIKSTPKIIFSSSTQENRDNLYGKSKRVGRELLENWAKNEKAQVTSLIIPNVFGPFGKPFYNSFIATFCHQIIKGEQPEIIQDGRVDLIYVNELSEAFFEEIIKTNQERINRIEVSYTSRKKVSEVLELLNNFKTKYLEFGEIPDVKLNSFELNLFNTFTSFIAKNYFPREFVKHIDNRGSFVEIIRANCAGQSSYSTTVPNITRGNHYHTRKIERFAVISGKASIKLRKIDTNEVFEYILDGEKPAYVDMPIWYTHNITNIGDTELITLFWINEPFDPKDADTYFLEV
ncbi:NAD-dependent epimerase/dehydratase family protein [Pseudotenacibaculum sp. MALMAid0570]|uniref:polysaccharide biosynthesis C-terminal domain-containing protein n=1 Tax=Pseudotenacibaculum sp. MALMAid0570 TaxID=3143938 RepID=UPI0032DF1CCD